MKQRTFYINMKGSYGIETVDEFDDRKEAVRCLKEYRFGDASNYYYLSQRCTNDWKNK